MKKQTTLLAAFGIAVFLISAPIAEAARRTEGLSWVHCEGRSTIRTMKWGSSKLTAYRCSNKYTFAHVSSGSKKLKRAVIANATPFRYTYQKKEAKAYAVTSNMTLLDKGNCYTAFGWTTENSSRSFKFCV